MTRKVVFEQIDEEHLKSIAHVIGSASAASKVLVEMQRRRDAGQDPVCYFGRGRYFVLDARETDVERG